MFTACVFLSTKAESVHMHVQSYIVCDKVKKGSDVACNLVEVSLEVVVV